MKVTVEVSPALAAALRGRAGDAQRVAHDGLQELGRAWVDEARQLARTGPYADSMGMRVESDAVVVGTRSPLGVVLERGRRPGKQPPTQSIAKRSASGDPGSAAKAIGRSGTRGRWVVRRARQAVFDSGRQAEIVAGVARRIGELGSGG